MNVRCPVRMIPVMGGCHEANCTTVGHDDTIKPHPIPQLLLHQLIGAQRRPIDRVVCKRNNIWSCEGSASVTGTMDQKSPTRTHDTPKAGVLDKILKGWEEGLQQVRPGYVRIVRQPVLPVALRDLLRSDPSRKIGLQIVTTPPRFFLSFTFALAEVQETSASRHPQAKWKESTGWQLSMCSNAVLTLQSASRRCGPRGQATSCWDSACR